jgi:hypothetical protein
VFTNGLVADVGGWCRVEPHGSGVRDESSAVSVRRKSPAPTTSNVERAICNPTSGFPLRPLGRRVVLCDDSFRLLDTSVLAANHAGANPNSMPVIRMMTVVQAKTTQSNETLMLDSSHGYLNRPGRILRHRYPSSRPPHPPSAASSRDSVSSWRAIRTRPVVPHTWLNGEICEYQRPQVRSATDPSSRRTWAR